MRQAEDIELVTPLGRRAGLHWRTENAPRVLCLHGWLDNAASFIPLAPLLDKLEVFALDFPGHGNSEHRHMSGIPWAPLSHLCIVPALRNGSGARYCWIHWALFLFRRKAVLTACAAACIKTAWKEGCPGAQRRR